MSNSVQPHRWQPTRLPRPWDFPGKNTGVGCHFLFQCIKVKSASEVTQSRLTLHYPMDCSPPGSPVPFVNWFLYFLHFVFKVFDYLFILNSFSGSLPISSSFIWTSVFLVCSFIRVVFLCLFTVFFNLSSWKFPFPRLQGKLNSFLEEGWILASFWFLTS